ncbi:MAG: hypothetical protein GY868_11500 [Deltaproteobacteria bacterium]|nr:hypothetical protein [Deltaproteobacteria bacterium]
MKLLFYAPLLDEGNRQLNSLIDNFTVVSDLEIYRSIDVFSDRMRHPQTEVTVVVLFATSPEVLADIIAIKDLFFDTRVIIVLPDRQPDTISKGHMLRPRFVTYADTDLAEMSAVIDKMLGTVSCDKVRKKR